MAAIASERRLAAILVADVVGFSRLVEADEAGTLAAMRKLRTEVIDPLLARLHGRLVKLMGDGSIAEFGSAVDAVRCAIAIQSEWTALQVDTPAGHRIRLRIGINLGDVIVEGDDLLGDGVNVAARLEQLCDPGGVLISGTAYDHLQGKLDLPLDFAGEQQVKNISRPVRVYRVRLDGTGQPWRLRLRQHLGRARVAGAACLAIASLGAGVWWLQPVNPASSRPSVAVLPFDNYGGDETTGRLADGVTEDIITDLAHYRELEVIARNSTMAYKGVATDIRQIGMDLNVRYVLEGSIQRQADRVRVTAQLIETTSGSHVWSERWDRPVEDVFAVQAELAESVAAKIGGYTGTIVAADRDAAKRKRPRDLSAYDFYLLGVEAKHRDTKDSLDTAIVLLKSSIEIDPRFARAWTALSWSYSLMKSRSEDWNGFYKLQLGAAQRAVELDPMDAEAHAALATALAIAGDFTRAEAEFGKSLGLNPNSADILTFYSGWASSLGKPDEGLRAAERAIRLNPNSPAWALDSYQYAYFMVGRYEEALRFQLRRPKESYRDGDYVFLAGSLALLGRGEEARQAVAEGLALNPEITIEGFTGRPDWREAERKLLVEAMRKAGFPICASEGTIRANPNLVRLPECKQA